MAEWLFGAHSKGGLQRSIYPTHSVIQSGVPGITYGVLGGEISQFECGDPGELQDNNTVLYFRGEGIGDNVFRRSLVIVLRNYPIGSCESINNIDSEFAKFQFNYCVLIALREIDISLKDDKVRPN